MTTGKIWKYTPSLKRQFWKEKTFWSDGYFACSVGNAPMNRESGDYCLRDKDGGYLEFDGSRWEKMGRKYGANLVIDAIVVY